MPGTEAATPGILTDAQIRKAKAATKPYKLTDGGGLHLYVTPAGGKLWRLRYEFERKEKLLSIGPYSVVGLADARAAATDTKWLLRDGRDPAVEKRLRRLGVITDGRTMFEAIAREWHELNKPMMRGYRWMLTAASRITSYTRRGWESIGTWLDATSVTLAFIRFARNRCSSGCMVRSSDPTI